MLLSVIIPVYNTKACYIEDCLDSLKLLDNLCDYEAIIVNDGSSAEDTLSFLDKLTQINKKILHSFTKVMVVLLMLVILVSRQHKEHLFCLWIQTMY